MNLKITLVFIEYKTVYIIMDLVPHAAPPAAYGYPSLWSQYIPPNQCGTVFRIVIGGIVRFFIIS